MDDKSFSLRLPERLPRIYGTRFMLPLDETSQIKLQQLISHFGVSKATIIRQLIMQASPEDFPTSWQLKAAARRVRQAPHALMGHDREPHP